VESEQKYSIRRVGLSNQLKNWLTNGLWIVKAMSNELLMAFLQKVKAIFRHSTMVCFSLIAGMWLYIRLNKETWIRYCYDASIRS
jgi:hypothetical protein